MLPRSTEIQPCVAPIRPSPPPLSSFSKSKEEVGRRKVEGIGSRTIEKILQARQGIANGKAIKAKAWQDDCLSPGKAMHCSRNAKTKGGQGMTHSMTKQGVAKAWQADCLSPGKECIAHGMPRPRVAKA
ncbi:hypothetical protein RHGRI_011006 [Rhododendron griersonianum]|uniref:Uncharacterized protein n=1 Tax=Rhododendron griersonianum TaxID=479676 RepID=A0AAV6KLI4_9ERIC|nr:hypothetical protein RHGRI_011006 [Rhododendron griersonianum]